MTVQYCSALYAPNGN